MQEDCLLFGFLGLCSCGPGHCSGLLRKALGVLLLQGGRPVSWPPVRSFNLPGFWLIPQHKGVLEGFRGQQARSLSSPAHALG